MNERVVQFRVGVMVLATVFITAILIAVFDGLPALVDRPYTLYIKFERAPGISTGTPVTKNGIRIGRVAAVKFAEDLDPGSTGVIVTVHIDADRKIHRDEEPVVQKSLLGVGGDTSIEFVRRRPPDQASTIQVKDRAADIPPGSMIEGGQAEDPFSAFGNLEGKLGGTMQSLARTSDEIGMLARRVNDLIRNNDEQFVRIVGKTETALDNISSAAGNINTAATHANNLLGDPAIQQNVRKVVQDLPQTIAQMNSTINTMRQTFEAADRNLRNFEGLTKPLGERGPQLVANIEEAMQKINRVAENLSDLTAAINSSDGTIGKLINDQQLYNQVTQAIANVNCMIRELKPIVDNARIFTDKLARHPETLTRGIFKPSSGLK